MKLRYIIVGFILFFVFITAMASTAVAFQPFPDTGQTKCYGDGGWNTDEIACPQPGEPFYGQDAQYQPRIPRSYTKLGMNGVELAAGAAHVDDGGPWIMTRDNVTGLIWELKRNANRSDTHNWQDAQDVFVTGLNGSTFGGFSDWRLPTKQELVSLVDIGRSDPAITVEWFPKTVSISGFYWTVTEYSLAPNRRAWRVSFTTGKSRYDYKSSRFYVRAVRAGTVPASRFVDNNDGTITDSVTGLMWQKGSSPDIVLWEWALEDVEDMTLAGYTDWRLPNRNELLTLIDDTQHRPAVYPPFRADTRSSYYWTSSTGSGLPRYAWAIDKTNGIIERNSKTTTGGASWVRAVRGGHSGTDIPQPLPVLINDDLSININCLDVFGDKYSMIFNYVNGFMWELNMNSIAAAQTDRCQSVDDRLSVHITCADYAGSKLGFTLTYNIGLSWDLDIESLRGMTPAECN